MVSDSGGTGSHQLSTLTGLAAGGYIWIQTSNMLIAIIGTFIVAYIASTRIGKVIASVVWIAFIAFFLWLLNSM